MSDLNRKSFYSQGDTEGFIEFSTITELNKLLQNPEIAERLRIQAIGFDPKNINTGIKTEQGEKAEADISFS